MSYRRAADRYRLGVSIYKHESCTVSEAYDLASNRPVIIKTKVTDSEDEINSLLDESTIQMKLQHENICEVLGVFLQEGNVNIVLERMECDLEAAVRRKHELGERISEQEIVKMMKEVSAALCFAKEKGVAHRDIKPGNIFLAGDGTYKVGDFGSALQVISAHSVKHTLIGTPLYLSPQLASGYLQSLSTGDNQVEYDPFKADVYALGITALYMAYGGKAIGLIALHGKVDVLAKVAELQYSDWFKQIVSGMLAHQENMRVDIEYVRASLSCPPHPGYDPSQATLQEVPPLPHMYTYGYCAFCRTSLQPTKRQFQVSLLCNHLVCTQMCFLNNAGDGCHVCIQSQSGYRYS